ncbi:XAP5 domain-containing protein [Gaeumannomyces tritici R3-111a-1]|uniref:XAP5 domain-containing protein n=1 Tax=Gaeumannomyces tritici (strain R3-111a-1) TaxID=644352 RepID=J3PK33_GAET3|nr:XAP5 domain-containing protein [Gaeumannomyces tritici R3-111a-1]EJT68549.1 XAP5 domain-containing protein [Gaeumannomyces tritici R3-111a-1]
MSNPPPSRFTTGNQTTHERLTTTTVGLVALSDFRKRRAEVLEQQEREAREKNKQAAAAAAAATATATQTPDRSRTGTPANGSEGSDAERQLKKKKTAKRAKVSNKLSFAADGDEDDDDDAAPPRILKKAPAKPQPKGEASPEDGNEAAGSEDASGAAESSGRDEASASESKRPSKPKITPNASVGVIPRALTKAALRREAAEREALRKEFLALQAAIKATEIAIPFVFYDGTNLPGGTVTVKKGDFTWVFLDKSRKVGAKLGVGGERIINARRDWARVGVDDLMLVRGTIIIPHHYEFYFFIMNKTLGPGNRPLFNYSVEAPPKKDESEASSEAGPPAGLLRRTGDQERAAQIQALEGAQDDPNMTKVVDRRWYERNKHIYPASVWQEFEPDKDYSKEVRRDLGGNTFFYSR